MKSAVNVQFGYDIKIDKSGFKPTQVVFWKDEAQFKKHHATEPLKYMADALVGLSLVQLNQFIKSPVQTPKLNYSFVREAWMGLDPHFELFKRSQERVLALQSQTRQMDPRLIEEFENNFNTHFENAQKPWGIDLTQIWPLLESMSWLEERMQNPLLYNFGLKFSKNFTNKLHVFYSFLFHLRSLVAVDYNAHINDPSHESVKVDAITDYLPKSEYVVNDALLYWTFQKLSQPFTGAHSDGRVEKLLASPLYKAFHKYSHNACHLIDNLPASFLTSMNQVELEEALYLVQMDWLLGAEAGLLFKIREEIYGVQNGYENLFWNEIDSPTRAKPMSLSICCHVDENYLSKQKAA